MGIGRHGTLPILIGALSSCDNGDWAQYNGILLTGITALRLQCAAGQTSGRIEANEQPYDFNVTSGQRVPRALFNIAK